MSLKESFLNIIKENGIKTTHSGNNVFILCPFHSDKNPSMIVNDYTGYCFACEEKYTFNEILEKYNIDKKLSSSPNKESEKHYKFNEILEGYFKKSKKRLQEILNSKDDSYIKTYLLKERNIKKEVIENEDMGLLVEDQETVTKLKKLKKEYPELSESIDSLMKLINKNEDDTILFFYRNSNYNISAIKFRTPRLNRRLQFKFWRKGKKNGVWGLKRISTKKDKILGVEGEFNLLALKSVLPDTNVVALGSSTNFDVFTIKDILERFDIDFYYCYDNDEAGFKVVDELRKHVKVYAFTTVFYNDLDEARKQIRDDKEFIKYLKDRINEARLFKDNTKNWNGYYYNVDDFDIRDNCLFYKDKKVSNTPFLIKRILVDKEGKHFIQVFDKKGDVYTFPQEVLLDENRNIELAKYGFNFTSMDGKIIALFVKSLLMENFYELEKVGDSVEQEAIPQGGVEG